MKSMLSRIAANPSSQTIQVRQPVQVSRPSQAKVNQHYSQPLQISPALQKKVFEVHQQIRQELGDVKYALLGKGMAAVLMGVENDDLNALCPDMIAVPDTTRLSPRNMGFLRG